jgi:hypothetical protein
MALASCSEKPAWSDAKFFEGLGISVFSNPTELFGAGEISSVAVDAVTLTSFVGFFAFLTNFFKILELLLLAFWDRVPEAGCSSNELSMLICDELSFSASVGRSLPAAWIRRDEESSRDASSSPLDETTVGVFLSRINVSEILRREENGRFARLVRLADVFKDGPGPVIEAVEASAVIASCFCLFGFEAPSSPGVNATFRFLSPVEGAAFGCPVGWLDSDALRREGTVTLACPDD